MLFTHGLTGKLRLTLATFFFCFVGNILVSLDLASLSLSLILLHILLCTLPYHSLDINYFYGICHKTTEIMSQYHFSCQQLGKNDLNVNKKLYRKYILKYILLVCVMRLSIIILKLYH